MTPPPVLPFDPTPCIPSDTAPIPLTGAELIAAERQRQITHEGYTDSNDDIYPPNILAKAAACYLHELRAREHLARVHKTPAPGWPWPKASWKPTEDRVRQLTKAGALIAAEIDLELRRSSSGS